MQVRADASGRVSGVPLDFETANVYDFEGDRICRIHAKGTLSERLVPPQIGFGKPGLGCRRVRAMRDTS
jgi:hypothetical protein